MDELTPEQRFAAESSDTMVPRLLMQGMSQELVVAKLVRLDWPEQSARVLVAAVAEDLRRYHESPESRARLVQEAWGHVFTGVCLAVLGGILGLGVLLLSAMLPLPFIIVAFGSCLAGLTLVARNWGRWRLYRRDALPFGPAGPEGRRPIDHGAFTDRPGM
jgi:hypothetical protein